MCGLLKPCPSLAGQRLTTPPQVRREVIVKINFTIATENAEGI